MCFFIRRFEFLPFCMLLVVLAIAAGPRQAMAFSEDECASKNGGWRACVERACQPGGENLVCESATMATQYTGGVVSQSTGARSVHHFDVTYLLAQSVGFTPRQAYQIASYDEATDSGVFDLRDAQANLVFDRTACKGTASDAPQCIFNTINIGGVGRNNFNSGGIFFHFHTLPTQANVGDGLTPQPDNAQQEPFLFNLKQWALGKSVLCMAGLTSTATPGSGCYVSPVRKQTTLLGRIPFVNQLGTHLELDWFANVAEQKIAVDSQSGQLTPASDLARELPPYVDPQLVRLGIYIHALQDRISHHRCIQASHLEGPRPANAPVIFTNALVKGVYDFFISHQALNSVSELASYPLAVNPEFFFEFNRQECDQPTHFQRHSFEVGIDQDKLDPKDRTAEAAMRAAYQELVFFAKRYGVYKPVIQPKDQTAFLQALRAGIEQSDPGQRIAGVSDVATRYSLLPLPGHAGETVDDWLAHAGQGRLK